MLGRSIFCARLEVSKDAMLGIGYCIRCDQKLAGEVRFPELLKLGRPKTASLMQHWREIADQHHRCSAIPILPYDGRFDNLVKDSTGKVKVKEGEFIDIRDL